MDRAVLMIAYHYPPCRGSSGIQRTLTLTRDLRELGWRPIVLTAHQRAYPQTSVEQLSDIPADVVVRRAWALDAAKHLAVRGAYIRRLALPDRWASWWLGAVPAGLRLIRKHKPRVIWSTYPIATAHKIGHTLARWSGLPWIADFRDPMSEPDFPSDPTVRRAAQKIERSAVRRCAHAVFTTEGMLEMYASRYPELPRERWRVIANGFDEEAFHSLDVEPPGPAPAGRRLLFLHSGLLYPSERDPTAFFDAVRELKKTGAISAADIRIVLRASGNEEHYARTIRGLEIDDIISLEPPIPYRQALAEMLSADGLFLFQASNCNHQVPAKAYEYLRAKRPVLAFTDPRGDTAGVLRGAGVGVVARYDSTPEIMAALSEFILQVRSGRGAVASDDVIRSHSRRHRAEELAALLDSLAG